MNSSRVLSVVDNPSWALAWEVTVFVTALYSVLVIPIKIGINKNLMGAVYDWIDLFTYFIYVADLFISMRTTYIDVHGDEIRDARVLFRRYLFSIRFCLDFLSLFNLPFVDSIISGEENAGIRDILALCGLLKIVKITRI